MQKPLQLMIVAGEASGDSHAADLIREIHEIEPATTFFGSAGPKMRAAGVEAIVEADSLSVVGIGAVASSLPMFLNVLNKLKREARQRKPDAVILVDFPEFNLKLAKSMKKQGLRIIYYISPQIWAWRKYRIRTIRRDVDLLISILPFEKEWYASHGVDHVMTVRNPLLDKVRSSTSGAEFRSRHGLREDAPLVALLPGSRGKEVARILPEMLDASSRMAETDPSIQFVIAIAPNRNLGEVKSIREKVEAEGTRLPSTLISAVDETYDALNASDAAAVTSGTATLEAGILGTPMVVVYKVPQFDYQVLKPLVDVPHIGLINLIAGERLATELVQEEFTGSALSAELLHLLDPNANTRIRAKLAQVLARFTHEDNTARAGKVVLDFVSGMRFRE